MKILCGCVCVRIQVCTHLYLFEGGSRWDRWVRQCVCVCVCVWVCVFAGSWCSAWPLCRPPHQTVCQGNGACGWFCFLLALELVCSGFLKLGCQLGQVLIKVLIGQTHRRRDTHTHRKIEKNWPLLKYSVVIRNVQRQRTKIAKVCLWKKLGSVKSWVKLIIPSAMDLFGIWKQLAQGQTGLIGGEAHRFSRLVWGLLIPLGSEPTLRSSDLTEGWKMTARSHAGSY